MMHLEEKMQNITFFQAKSKLEFFKHDSNFWLSIVHLSLIAYIGLITIINDSQIEITTIFILWLLLPIYKLWFRRKQTKKFVDEIQNLSVSLGKIISTHSERLKKLSEDVIGK